MILVCKGADSVIFQRLRGTGNGSKTLIQIISDNSSNEDEKLIAKTFEHIKDFAVEGLRTLLYAIRVLSPEEVSLLKVKYELASNAIIDRRAKLDELAEQLEENLELIGATAIEDKLQDGVPETLSALLKADIRLWVLTGDKRYYLLY